MNNQDGLTLGFIIDISDSMRKSWLDTLDPLSHSKIDVIRRAFNNIFNERKTDLSLLVENKNVEVFALGIGLRLRLDIYDTQIENPEKIISDTGKSIVLVDNIVDLIALSELIPSNFVLENIQKDLKNTWQNEAQKLLTNIQNIPDINTEGLKHEVRNGIMNASKESLAYSYYKYRGNLSNWEQKISQIAEQETQRHIVATVQKAISIFESQRKEQTDFIVNKLKDFLTEELKFAFGKYAIGHNPQHISTYFNKDKAEDLLSEIIQKVKNDVDNGLGSKWNNLRMGLNNRLKLLCLNLVEVRHTLALTKYCIRKEGYKRIIPFVETTVATLYEECFGEVVEYFTNEWLLYSNQSEVIVPFKQIGNLFPEKTSKNIYTSMYMFGGTPMIKAINRAISRLLRRGKDKKVLIIISDGKFKDNDLKYTSELMTKEDVLVISLRIVNGIKERVKTGIGKISPMETLASKPNDIKWVNKNFFPEMEKFCFNITDEQQAEHTLELIVKSVIRNS